MSRSRRSITLLLTAALLAAGLWLGNTAWTSRSAPDEPFVLIDGRKLAPRDLRGGPLLVNFWATSCKTCLEEIPDLIALHEAYAGRGLTIIGVAMPYDPPQRVVDFTRQRQLPYAIALDLENRLVRAYGDVQLTPTNILIAADGRIVDRHTGRLDLQQTRRQIERLLFGET